MYSPLVSGAVLLLIYMVFWFVFAVVKKDNSIADIAWGLGFVLVGWWVHLAYGNPLLLVILVTLWGVRLAGYIFIRNKGKEEDWRYKKWRNEWGENWLLKAFSKVFLLQGFLLWVIALPLMLSTGKEYSVLTIIQILGIAIFIIGFLWEAISDWQLYNFKKDPQNKGKIMKSGLWRLSRHPNYFGEIILWWGIFIVSTPYAAWYLLIISPLTITFLLVKVSGVPMLESKYKGNNEYRNYCESTNALIPDLIRLFEKN